MSAQKEAGNVSKDRQKAIDLAITSLEKQYGKGIIMKLGAKAAAGISEDEIIPTGSLTLDHALGIGGLPRGRVVEIYGPESSGKTTLALSAIAEAQKKGGMAAFVDAEHALDVVYARNLGVNVDELLVSQPDSGEQALEVVDTLVRSASIDVIVIDSVAALTPRAEIEGEMGDSHMGLHARLMSQALRQLTASLARSKTIAVFINQIRMKIGVMFGSPETTTGGNALKFYSSVRLDIRRIATIKKNDQEAVGNRCRVKVVKNKMAPPFRQCEFDLIYGKGISRSGEILDLAVTQDILEKAGSWYSYKGERLGQGREQVMALIDATPKLRTELELAIRNYWKAAAIQAAAETQASIKATAAAAAATATAVAATAAKATTAKPTTTPAPPAR